VAMGASDVQTVKAFVEAEAYEGPSLILAYSHCIAHGINMRTGMEQQKLAVQAGHWPLCRFNPDNIKAGKNPLQLDSKEPSVAFQDYAYNETRYKMLTKIAPEKAKELMHLASADAQSRWQLYKQMAEIQYGPAD